MLNSPATTSVNKQRQLDITAPLRNIASRSVQFNIMSNKPIAFVFSLPAADLKLPTRMPMTFYPVSAVNASVVTLMIVLSVISPVVETQPVSVVTYVHCSYTVTPAIAAPSSAAHCIMNANKNLLIMCNKTISSAFKRKECKVSDYNDEPDVDTFLKQFDLIATYNDRSESEKAIKLASTLKATVRQAMLTGLARESLTYELMSSFMNGYGKASAICAGLPTT